MAFIPAVALIEVHTYLGPEVRAVLGRGSRQALALGLLQDSDDVAVRALPWCLLGTAYDRMTSPARESACLPCAHTSWMERSTIDQGRVD